MFIYVHFSMHTLKNLMQDFFITHFNATVLKLYNHSSCTTEDSFLGRAFVLKRGELHLLKHYH